MPRVPIVLKSGSLSLLETYGPVQACNGIALPFTYA
jgi:NAD-dependent oxidoreductase involved in siderophore biosynthesis